MAGSTVMHWATIRVRLVRVMTSVTKQHFGARNTLSRLPRIALDNFLVGPRPVKTYVSTSAIPQSIAWCKTSMARCIGGASP